VASPRLVGVAPELDLALIAVVLQVERQGRLTFVAFERE
jgi:hypothetical protein